MYNMPTPHFQVESWGIVFSWFSLINFVIVYIWPIYQSLDQRIKFWNSIHFTNNQSLDKRIWFTIFFSSQRQLNSVRNIDFLGGTPTSICHFFHPSVRLAPYLRNRTTSSHSFLYTCVKWYLHVFFVFFFLKFWFHGLLRGQRWGLGVKGQKIAQNEK